MDRETIIQNSTVPSENISHDLSEAMEAGEAISNTTELPEDMQFNSAHVISIVGYSTLFLVSSIANCTVLMILIRRYKKTKSRVNLLLIHLAIADLMVTFLMMPGEIGWAATVYWAAGDVACRFYKFGSIFGLFLSSNILICISLDRFYAIVWPLSAGKAARNMKICLWAAWIFSFLSAAPQIYIYWVATHPNYTWYTQCIDFWFLLQPQDPARVWQTTYIIFGMVMVYFIPLVVIVITYSVILFTISRKTSVSGNSETNQNGGDGLRRSGTGVLNRARARTLKMTFVIVLVFIMCWTPYYIISLWFLFGGESFKSIDPRIEKTLYIFACTNSVMDPIVYGFFNLRKSQNTTRSRNQPAFDTTYHRNRTQRNPRSMDPCISRIHSPNISPAISNCDLTKREEFSHEFNGGQNTLAPPTSRTIHLRSNDEEWTNGGNRYSRKRSSAADVAV